MCHVSRGSVLEPNLASMVLVNGPGVRRDMSCCCLLGGLESWISLCAEEGLIMLVIRTSLATSEAVETEDRLLLAGTADQTVVDCYIWQDRSTTLIASGQVDVARSC